MTINYQTNPSGYAYIDNLSTSDGREVEFSYTDEGNGDIRLTEVEANGQSWTYNYAFPPGILNPPPQLISIIRPDNREWEFEYNPLSTSDEAGSLALRQITTPMGGTIEYTYDYVRFAAGAASTRTTVVTAKTTDGTDVTPGTWTYDYTPGFESASGYDETLIFQPQGIRKYYHLFRLYRLWPGSNSNRDTNGFQF